MAMPIFPNIQHTKGREPIRTQPVFPFTNCYFWMWSACSLRIPIKLGDDGWLQ